jgi:hypothetical protein
MSDFSDKLKKHRESEARAIFAAHVQSVAFQISLSRNMIEGLSLVRSGSHFIETTVLSALHRRGLVWIDAAACSSTAPPGHNYAKLTRPGELMCELLVEANLIPAADSKRKAAQ